MNEILLAYFLGVATFPICMILSDKIRDGMRREAARSKRPDHFDSYWQVTKESDRFKVDASSLDRNREVWCLDTGAVYVLVRPEWSHMPEGWQRRVVADDGPVTERATLAPDTHRSAP